MKDQKSKEMIEKIERTDKLCPQCDGAGNDIDYGGSCRTCNGRGIISIKFYELIKEKIAKKFGVKDLYHEFFINGCSLDEVLDDTITATNTSFREQIVDVIDKIDNLIFHSKELEDEYEIIKEELESILASLDGDEIKQNG